jgi:hypothetical protein
MPEPHWDKRITKELVELGLSWESALIALGVIAEQRQIADRIGYIRGYNNGFANGEKHQKVVKCPECFHLYRGDEEHICPTPEYEAQRNALASDAAEYDELTKGEGEK